MIVDLLSQKYNIFCSQKKKKTSHSLTIFDMLRS